MPTPSLQQGTLLQRHGHCRTFAAFARHGPCLLEPGMVVWYGSLVADGRLSQVITMRHKTIVKRCDSCSGDDCMRWVDCVVRRLF